MAFCGKCGTQVNDGVKFCPGCGAPVGAQEQVPFQQVQQPFSAAQDAQQNKVMAVLSYIIFFIPLLTGDHKKSPFVKYHANQGTVLFLGTLAFGIVYWILNALLVALLLGTGAWGAWSVITTILGILWFVPTIFCVLGIIHAVKGEMKPLPLIGKINILK